MKSTLQMLALITFLTPALTLAHRPAHAQDIPNTPGTPDIPNPPGAPAIPSPPATPDLAVQAGANGLAAPPVPTAPPDTAPADTAPAQATQVYVAHAPVSETPSGELTLSFSVSPIDRVEAVIVRWRGRDADATVHESVVGRRADGWFAEIRAEEVAPPGIVYWVVRRDPGTGDPSSREHPVFASESHPHPVVVLDSELQSYERRMLARRGGHRYRSGASIEYVDLGQRTLPVGVGGPRAASYSKVTARFAYAFFGIVDEIRFNAGRLFGSQQLVGIDEVVTNEDLGFYWGGGELVFRLHDLVRARSGIVFGVSKTGFELGGSLALVIGDPDGTSLEIGGDGISGVGGTGRLRLGWATVPHVPMGATIELTNFPTADLAGVRLLFDAAYELYPGALLRMTAGYRGWTSVVGGPSLAADLLFAF